MTKQRILKILKIAIGSSISIFIADFFGLDYSSSAGIITLLTIHDTKKETLILGWKRILSFVLALVISAVVFHLLGYHLFAFGVFLFFFVTLCYSLNLNDTIAVNAVMASHILVDENMGIPALTNEAALMFIGVTIGVLLNLYMPKMTDIIRKNQTEIENDMKQILIQIILAIETINYQYNDQDFNNLEQKIEDSLQRAYENMNNSFKNESIYFIHYMEMRMNQTLILHRIFQNSKLLTAVPLQTRQITSFIQKIEVSFHEHNNANALLLSLNALKQDYRKQELPVTREEFENRALLYQMLNDLESFLKLKQNFVNSLSDKQLQKYW